jgi:hypothetical protein
MPVLKPNASYIYSVLQSAVTTTVLFKIHNFVLYIIIIIQYNFISAALQTGRSRVRFPMMPLEIFIDIILPVALWPWG